MIKVVGFDVGHTLDKYHNPLNWTSFYRPALCKAAASCNIDISNSKVDNAVAILAKYNTRINYREIEVSSAVIFNEIITAWNCSNTNVHVLVFAFYSFFQTNAHPFPKALETLKELKNKGIKIEVFTDVTTISECCIRNLCITFVLDSSMTAKH